MIQVESISKIFRCSRLNNISFTANQKKLFDSPNAGKTTLARLSGFILPDEGLIKVNELIL